MNAPIVKPALDRPRGLWSLWDIMQPFHANLMMMHMNVIGGQRVHSEWSKRFQPSKEVDVFDGPDVSSHIDAYTALEVACTELGLTASRASIQRILEKLAKPNSKRSDISQIELELGGRLLDEMRGRLFFSLSLAEAEYYLHPLKKWEEIVNRFPDVITDVEESVKCFALSRYAATVFHSLQVVEMGLIELGRLIVVTDPQTGWNATTSRLKKILDAKYHDRTPFQQQYSPFLEQIDATTEVLKSAWRNKISHAQGKLVLLTRDFTPEVAEEILFASRSFMRRLATDAPTSPDSDA
jgi:hypothetical protein